MTARSSRPNLPFAASIAVAVGLPGLAAVASWHFSQPWVDAVWRVCRHGLETLAGHLPPPGLLLLPALLLIMVGRVVAGVIKQLRATRQLPRHFLVFRQPPPARLKTHLSALGILTDTAVFLNLPAPRAFCLGFWRPKIWITAGMLNLLSEPELAAVLAHEAHHLTRRDPLTLFISRTLSAAFFFLPLLKTLAQAAEVHQEVAADRAAILHLGSDFPLLCALQKLIKHNRQNLSVSAAACTPFNATESRLRRLVNSPRPGRWRRHGLGALVNLSVIAVLGGSIMVAARPPASPPQVTHCAAGPAQTAQTQVFPIR
ncbi:MAG: M56 family metallopeptidase [Anaerolineae bacterium]